MRSTRPFRIKGILISSSYLYIICLYKRESPMYRFQCDRRPGETVLHNSFSWRSKAADGRLLPPMFIQPYVYRTHEYF
jgi:hypothetical protein